MTYDEFITTYKPRKNHLDPYASFDGYLFETFGHDLDFVLSQNLTNIWTVIEGDNDTLYLESGFHVVNRLGYFITQEPNNNPQFSILID